MAQPVLFVIAGPNGAGKSTLTKSGRFEGARIFDPDAVARTAAPDDPARAAVLAGRRVARERRAAMALADETWFYANDDPDIPLREAAIAVFPDGPPPRWVAEACLAALLPPEAEGG